MVAGVDRMMGALAAAPQAGTAETYTLVLGATPSRPREVYNIRFQPAPGVAAEQPEVCLGCRSSWGWAEA